MPFNPKQLILIVAVAVIAVIAFRRVPALAKIAG